MIDRANDYVHQHERLGWAKKCLDESLKGEGGTAQRDLSNRVYGFVLVGYTILAFLVDRAALLVLELEPWQTYLIAAFIGAVQAWTAHMSGSGFRRMAPYADPVGKLGRFFVYKVRGMFVLGLASGMMIAVTRGILSGWIAGMVFLAIETLAFLGMVGAAYLHHHPLVAKREIGERVYRRQQGNVRDAGKRLANATVTYENGKEDTRHTARHWLAKIDAPMLDAVAEHKKPFRDPEEVTELRKLAQGEFPEDLEIEHLRQEFDAHVNSSRRHLRALETGAPVHVDEHEGSEEAVADDDREEP